MMSSPLNQPRRPGCGLDCGIVLADPDISRSHAELMLRADGRLWLRDCVGTQGAFLLATDGAARAFVEKWFEWRDVPRYGQVRLSVAELRGRVVSYREPPKARPTRVRCACGAVKPTVSECDVYDRR